MNFALLIKSRFHDNVFLTRKNFGCRCCKLKMLVLFRWWSRRSERKRLRSPPASGLQNSESSQSHGFYSQLFETMAQMDLQETGHRTISMFCRHLKKSSKVKGESSQSTSLSHPCFPKQCSVESTKQPVAFLQNDSCVFAKWFWCTK